MIEGFNPSPHVKSHPGITHLMSVNWKMSEKVHYHSLDGATLYVSVSVCM